MDIACELYVDRRATRTPFCFTVPSPLLILVLFSYSLRSSDCSNETIVFLAKTFTMRLAHYIGFSILGSTVFATLPACSSTSVTPCSCPNGTDYWQSATLTVIGAAASDVKALIDDCKSKMPCHGAKPTRHI